MRYREALTFPISIRRDAAEPLHEQITAQISAAIEAGTVSQGMRIPSTRTLSELLGVSRGVAAEAYDALNARGYLAVRRGSGTFVQPPRAVSPVAGAPLRAEASVDLTPGPLWGEVFPIQAWRAAWRLASYQTPVPAEPPALGLKALRLAIAEHLTRTRGLASARHEVVVTSGATAGLRLICEAFGTEVAFERPIAPGLLHAASADRLETDRDGAVFGPVSPSIRAAVICPDGSCPLGTVMSPQRKLEALAWAQDGRYLLQTATNSVIRVGPSMLGSTANEAVIGEFSEILTPSLRIGYALVPQELAASLGRLIAQRAEQPSPVLQLALADLLRRGAILQQMRRLTRLLAAKRSIAETMLTGLGLAVRPGSDGILLIGHTRPAELQVSLRERRINVQTLDTYGITGDDLVLGYGHLPEAQLRKALLSFCSAYVQVTRPGEA